MRLGNSWLLKHNSVSKKRQKHESYFNVCLLGEPNNFPCEIMVKIEALVIMLIFRPLSSLLSKTTT